MYQKNMLNGRTLEKISGGTDAAHFLYTVKTNDTIEEIASKYDTTVEKLCSINGITDLSEFRVGIKIKIPYKV